MSQPCRRLHHVKALGSLRRSDDQKTQEVAEVLYTAAESIRIITALLYPILPYATANVWRQLGLGDIEHAAENGDSTTCNGAA